MEYRLLLYYYINKFIDIGSFVLSHGTALYGGDDTVTLNYFALKKTLVTVVEFNKYVAEKKGSSNYQNYDPTSDEFSNCNYDRGDNWLNQPMNRVN